MNVLGEKLKTLNKGKLYTTYFSKMKKAIGLKIGIVRFLQKWIDLEKYEMIHLPQLSPSKKLLLNYKDGNIDWEMYTTIFKEEMKSHDMKRALNRTQELLDEGKDITIICYCKDRNTCHRSLIGDYFEELGYEVNEIE